VLRYISDDQKLFQVFVANRVQTILNLSRPSQWKYVETKENPADDASCGLDAKELNEQQRLLKGPKFLWQPEKDWPKQPLSLGEIPEEDPEVKKHVNVCATTITDPATASTVTKLIHHYSSWYRLKKAVAVYLRVKAILKERRLRRMNDKPIKLNEDHSALTVLARLREKYWIVGANSAVCQLISSCVTCRRNRALPQMADLQSDRLTLAPPFTYVGVDLFVPYITKEDGKERKRYGALFTCLLALSSAQSSTHLK